MRRNSAFLRFYFTLFFSCRFLFGGEHGRFHYRPPDGAAPLYEAMLLKQKVWIEPCFSFGNIERNRLDGPVQIQHNIAFTPQPIQTNNITLPSYLENVCNQLAENSHEIWTMSKIANGWRFGEVNIFFERKFCRIFSAFLSIEMIHRRFIRV